MKDFLLNQVCQDKMKKNILYSLLVFLPLISAGQMQIGVHAGYNYFWFTKPTFQDYYYDYDYSKTAYSVSVSINERSVHTFNLGCELEYTHRSFEVHSVFSGLGGGNSAYFNFNLGNIYLLFKPQFVLGSKVRFFLYPGFYFGTILHSGLRGTYYSWWMGNPDSRDTINGNAVGYYPAFEFGLLAGWGIEVPVSKSLRAVFENNLSMNLLPVGSAWGSDKIKMLSLMVKVGLAYTIPQKTRKTERK